jgi:pilus assembly protein CpaC
MKRRILILTAVLLLTASPVLAGAPLSLTVDHGVPVTLKGAASSVFVANPEIADVQVMSPTQVMVFGKRTGETSFVASNSKGEVLAERTLIVTQDLSMLRAELNAAIPDNDIKVKPVPNGIILTGTVRDSISANDAYRIAMRYIPGGGDIINRIQVTGSNQIQIRVRFAEVQRSIDNSLGFNWQNIITAGSNMTVGLATGNGVHMVGTGIFNSGSVNNTGLFPRPSNASLSTPNDVLGVAATFGNFTVDGMIDALAQEGYLTVLAEPNLTAMSGETANFLAGGQYPIPVPQGNGTISISYQSYGISLAFTPTVLSGNRISLHVRPEVSELTETGSIVSDNITVPALTTRKAETTVEVASGESFAIAGLVNNSQTQSVNKFPMLGDLPVLGALFRSSHFVNGQTELVVIITPYIVRPSKKQLSLPTDGYALPTEYERYGKYRPSTENPDARPWSGDPVGVMEPPASSPTTPVSAAPEAMPAPAPVFAPQKAKAEEVSSVQDSEAVKPAVEKAEVKSSPVIEKSSPPLVLHSSRDADKRSGGLLVE